jgi:hypothetical protein
VIVNIAMSVVPVMIVMMVMAVTSPRKKRGENDGSADQSSLHKRLRVRVCDLRYTALPMRCGQQIRQLTHVRVRTTA